MDPGYYIGPLALLGRWQRALLGTHARTCKTERSSSGAAIRSKHGGYLSMDEKGAVRIKELQKAGDQEMFSEVALL